MTESTTPSRAFRPCPRCGALVVGSERFCAVCGTAVEDESTGREPGRGRVLLLTSAIVLLVVFAGVAWVYFSAPERRQEHAVSHLAGGAPYALALQPGNPPTAFSVTGGLASVSVDRGATWQRLPLNGTVAVAAVGPAPNAAFYLTGTRAWRGGSSGIDALSPPFPASDVRALTVDPTDSRRVYAVVANRGLYRSDNGGDAWSMVSSDVPAGATSLATTGGAAGLLYLGTGANGVFAGVAGEGWSNASGFVNGALPTRAIAAVAYDPNSGDRFVGPSGDVESGALYAGTDQGVFKSIDSGRSWSALPFHHPTQALAVDPTGSHLMFAVDANGDVYRSTDGGNSWQ